MSRDDELYMKHLGQFRDPSGDLEPPWAAFPTYTRYTIGWRMGSGEDWMHHWWRWLREEIPEDRTARVAYLHRHPASPYTWADFILRVIEPGYEEPDDDAAHLADRLRVADEGLVAPDVAYWTWVNSAERARAPWRFDESVPQAVRENPNLSAMVEIDFRHYLASPELGGEAMAALLVTPERDQTPWAWGFDPPEEIDYSGDAMSFPQAWYIWASSIFDDLPTLAAYIERHGAPPAHWRPTLEDWFGYLWEDVAQLWG